MIFDRKRRGKIALGVSNVRCRWEWHHWSPGDESVRPWWIHEVGYVLMMIMIVIKLRATHTDNKLYVNAKDECWMTGWCLRPKENISRAVEGVYKMLLYFHISYFCIYFHISYFYTYFHISYFYIFRVVEGVYKML